MYSLDSGTEELQHLEQLTYPCLSFFACKTGVIICFIKFLGGLNEITLVKCA